MDLKKVDDILGGADSWQNVDQTDGESEDHQDVFASALEQRSAHDQCQRPKEVERSDTNRDM